MVQSTPSTSDWSTYLRVSTCFRNFHTLLGTQSLCLCPKVPGRTLTGCQSSKLIHQILQSTFLQEFGLVFLQVTNDLRRATRLIQVRSFKRRFLALIIVLLDRKSFSSVTLTSFRALLLLGHVLLLLSLSLALFPLVVFATFSFSALWLLSRRRAHRISMNRSTFCLAPF